MNIKAKKLRDNQVTVKKIFFKPILILFQHLYLNVLLRFTNLVGEPICGLLLRKCHVYL